MVGNGLALESIAGDTLVPKLIADKGLVLASIEDGRLLESIARQNAPDVCSWELTGLEVGGWAWAGAEGGCGR